MNRKQIINIHLILATFFAPLLLIIGISGGLYLVGIKGEIKQQIIYQDSNQEFDFASKDRLQQIQHFLKKQKINYDFEYAVNDWNYAKTRPTSKEYYVFKLDNELLTVTKHSPNFIASLVELHKGHGPKLFRILQILLAIALFFILLSGISLALLSANYKNRTIYISALSSLFFVLIILL